jgi:acetylornithine deacetylase/succinyl-diaminopimelate desuccinylase-like protein
MSPWENYLNEHKDQYLEELLAFLRIPSISSLSDYRHHVQTAAEWVETRMKAAGIESVRIMPTGGQPVVYGDWLHAPGKPTLLIYGHFDVQPVDPLELWDNHPFEPSLKEGRIYARGATDDKGNMLVPIIAVESILEAEGRLPLNLKFLFEGQEEIGSPQLPHFMAANKELFAADLVLSADGSQRDEDQPAMVLGTRGLCSVHIDAEGPDHDLHSGTYGGTIANPIHALIQVLDSMHNQEGRITIEGFYDDVRALTDKERAELARVPFDEAEYLSQIGALTVEINGIYGGFQGQGMKTVLPSTAHAKVSCRLVADQDPFKIADLVLAHVKRVAPPEVKVTARKSKSGGIPYLLPADHPSVQIATSVLRDLYGKEPYQIRMGGTIPANALFLEHLGAYTIVFAFGLPDERQHSPNEFFRVSSYERGQKAYGMLLHRLGEEYKPS